MLKQFFLTAVVVLLIEAGVFSAAAEATPPTVTDPKQSIDHETVEPSRPPLIKAPETELTINNGRIVGGLSKNGVFEWRGIPYAKPPVGPLRWRAPRAPENWNGIRDATQIHSRCVQYPNNYSGNDVKNLLGDEDCLYLNVFAPPRAKKQKNLPVMVWIHGGNNIWGHGGQYDGSELALSQNVIVVTINYRLGILGSFSHENNRSTALIAADRNPNFLVLDIQSSLKWVKDNIHHFGGASENITIFGESAGGHNVFSMIANPSAAGFFHKAIVQSGYVGSLPSNQAENGNMSYQGQKFITFEERLKDLDKHLRKTNSQIPATKARETFEQLTLEGIYKGLLKQGQHAPMLLMDESFSTCSSMLEAFSNLACHNQVPIIAGSNRDEAKLFLMGVPYFIKWSENDGHHKLFHPRMHDAVARYQSIQWELFSVDEPLRKMVEAGNSEVYSYRFDWDNLRSGEAFDYGEILGAAHAIEVPFVFNQFDLFIPKLALFTEETAEEREALSQSIMNYWGNFARTGIPKSPDVNEDVTLPKWFPIHAGDDQYSYFLRFDSDENSSTQMLKRNLSVNSILAALYDDKSIQNRNVRCGVVEAITFHYPRPLLEGEVLLPKGCLR